MYSEKVFSGRTMLLLKILAVLKLACATLLPTNIVQSSKNITSRISTADRIASHGYPVESHIIETRDGYILNLFRIPASPKSPNQSEPRPVVLMQHGMYSCSDMFLINGPDNGLAFMLADAGYDIWLGNARGNIYSRKHRRLSVLSRRFWHFSWHEIGTIDIAAMIDYILEQTKQKALQYVAHSQGATVYLVLMSTRPDYNKKIKGSHLLAPVAFTENTGDVGFRMLAPLMGTPGPISDILADFEVLPGNPYVQNAINENCGGNVRYPEFCRNLFIIYTNGQYENVNMTLAPLLAETHPAGGSSNHVIHYAQGYISKIFRQFDYGATKNKLRYGQINPPNYNLENISSPVFIYYSDYDAISSPKDVKKLASMLRNLKLLYRVPVSNWSHLDFLISLDVKRQINDLVMKGCNESERKEFHTENIRV